MAVADQRTYEDMYSCAVCGGVHHFEGTSRFCKLDQKVIIEARGGAGGTGSSFSTYQPGEIIAYRDAGFNTTVNYMRTPLAPYDIPQETPPAIFKHAFPVMISTGCSTCNSLAKVQPAEFDQEMYEAWYVHYINADRRGDTDFIIRHLNFIMKHMLECVSENTRDVILPEDEKEVSRVRKYPMIGFMFSYLIGFFFLIYAVLCHLESPAEALIISASISVPSAIGMSYLRRGDKKEENKLQIVAKGGKPK